MGETGNRQYTNSTNTRHCLVNLANLADFKVRYLGKYSSYHDAACIFGKEIELRIFWHKFDAAARVWGRMVTTKRLTPFRCHGMKKC